ncbi:MAG: radical SAM protein [Bacteroidetes bacterium]|nr:radical SAM protein [Bacteroidota bacterium]
MSGFLFNDVIFGPVRSRRLGLSLGINLLPLHSKYCSFNCIYCECGWTPPNQADHPEFPSRAEVRFFLEQRLQQLVVENYLPDALTYAGNGEPTLHPEFAAIVDDTLGLRNKFAPDAKVTVLSNSSMIHVPSIFQALQKLDHNILKLDAGSEKMFNLINNPVTPVQFAGLIENLKLFRGNLMIQSMFLRGNFKGQTVDNTTKEEVDAWIGHLVEINPKLVMIYPIARATPVHNLEKIDLQELEEIGVKAQQAGIKVQVYQ